MLSSATASDVRALADRFAEQAAERLLVNAALFHQQMAPPKDPKQRIVWEARQGYLRAEIHLAAIELERFLRIQQMAMSGTPAE